MNMWSNILQYVQYQREHKKSINDKWKELKKKTRTVKEILDGKTKT